MRPPVPRDDDFVREWNALAMPDRRRVRRLVRLGRPLSDPQEAGIAAAYARFQQSRVWMRFFWLWFVPGAILAFGIAASLHPVVVGAVLVLTAQAVFAHRNLGKAGRINARSIESR